MPAGDKETPTCQKQNPISSIHLMGDETTFTANTPTGEEFLRGPELTIPSIDAANIVASARAAGLIVQPFFD
jgi:hypothetical protein